jgi:hypothetical protein
MPRPARCSTHTSLIVPPSGLWSGLPVQVTGNPCEQVSGQSATLERPVCVWREQPAPKPAGQAQGSRPKAWKKLAQTHLACIPSIEYRTWLEEGGADRRAPGPCRAGDRGAPLTGVTTACFKTIMVPFPCWTRRTSLRTRRVLPAVLHYAQTSLAPSRERK